MAPRWQNSTELLMYALIQAVHEKRTYTNGSSKTKKTQNVVFISAMYQRLTWRLTQPIAKKDALVAAGPSLHLPRLRFQTPAVASILDYIFSSLNPGR